MATQKNDPETGGSNPISVDLCAVQGCCPKVTIYPNEDKVTIQDDFGGNVLLTKEQLRILRSDDRLSV